MTPGIHTIPSAIYHADPCAEPSLSNTIAKILIGRSALHAWHAHPRLGNGRVEDAEEEAKFNYGSACHDVLLEGGEALLVISPQDYPSKPKKAGEQGSIPKGWTNDAIRAARDSAKAAGRIPVLPPQANRISAMVEVAKRFIDGSEIAEYWTDAKSEVSAIWEEDGIWLRCRFDRLHNGHRFIGDYKSTKDAEPEAFSRHISRMGYHFQDAFYRRAVRALGYPDPRFAFLAQEITAPYACSLHDCSPALQEIADAQVERAVSLWRACMRTGKWPGYGGRIHSAIPNNYQMQEHEDLLLEEETS